MTISETKNLDQILSSLIMNQSLIIKKISGFSSFNKNIFLISSFEDYLPIENGLYISNSNISDLNEIKYFDVDTGWVEIFNSSNVIDKTSSDMTVPTSKSVYDLFNKISGNISGTIDESILEDYALYADLQYISGQINKKANKSEITNFLTEDDLLNYATKNDLLSGKGVFHLNDRFSNNFTPNISGLYIDNNGESRFYPNNNDSTYKEISKVFEKNIYDEESLNSHNTIPTTLAIFKFIKNLSGTIISNNTFDESKLNDYVTNEELHIVSSQISEKADKLDLNDYVTKEYLNNTKEIYYIDEHFSNNYTASTSGIYIDVTGETRFYPISGYTYNSISYPISNNIILDGKDVENISIPTTNSVYNFLNSEKDVISLISTSFDTFTPNTNGFYIDINNEIRYYKDGTLLNLSFEIIDDLSINENISDMKIASTYAISNYIKSLEERIAALEAKINQ